MQHRSRSRAWLAVSTALVPTLAYGSVAVAHDHDAPQGDPTIVFGCFPGPNGILTGGPVAVAPSVADDSSFGDLPFVTLFSGGPSANRIDIVFVGDGFQSGQLNSYATVVSQRWQTIKTNDPYLSYLPYFNAHRVDVTSIDSGVDNDPTPGILKNTALDSGFWCQGIERLLCANTVKTQDAASSAPDWDQILLLANSSKYGGAGYLEADICTFSAFDASSLQIALHELGHSFGNLADEYDYADGASYNGPELPEPNVSIQTQVQMQASGTKWAPWIGVSLPVVGSHGAFQGARYYQFGIRRPTSNSLMRSLGLPFNGPCLEQMIVEIHKATQMLDASSAAVGSALTKGTILSVTTLEPANHTLSKQWLFDGTPLAGATGVTFDTAGLTVPEEGGTLTLRLVDPTTKVKNEPLRTAWLTETYSWTILPPPCFADLDGNGVVDSTDLGVLLGSWGTGNSDLNGNGTAEAGDLSILLGAWGACP
jgi:IgA Peptidase M64